MLNGGHITTTTTTTTVIPRLIFTSLIICDFLTANWCQHWFEYFPNPPVNVLSVIENVLAFHDKVLLAHFVEHGITSQVSDIVHYQSNDNCNDL